MAEDSDNEILAESKAIAEARKAAEAADAKRKDGWPIVPIAAAGIGSAALAAAVLWSRRDKDKKGR